MTKKKNEKWYVVEYLNPNKSDCARAFSLSKKQPLKILDRFKQGNDILKNENFIYDHGWFNSKNEAISHIKLELNNNQIDEIYSDTKLKDLLPDLSLQDNNDVEIYGYNDYVKALESDLNHYTSQELGLKYNMNSYDYKLATKPLYKKALENNICITDNEHDFAKYLKKKVDNLPPAYECRKCHILHDARFKSNKVIEYPHESDYNIVDENLIIGTFLCIVCEEDMKEESRNDFYTDDFY